MRLNRENIQYAIKLMENAKALDMRLFQTVAKGQPLAQTLGELHRSGNSACLGGYIAISPKFRKDGGYSDARGAPVYGRSGLSSGAVGEWFGIPTLAACQLMFGLNDYYDIPLAKVTPEHVIAKLRQLLGEEKT